MNPNVDYLGSIHLLRCLLERKLISPAEARRIAARVKVRRGADIVISL